LFCYHSITGCFKRKKQQKKKDNKKVVLLSFSNRLFQSQITTRFQACCQTGVSTVKIIQKNEHAENINVRKQKKVEQGRILTTI